MKPPHRGVQPLHLVAVVAGAVVVAASASQEIRDPDIWWHAWIGAEILESRGVSGLGNSWAPFGDQDWTTTQWVPEVVYAVLVSAGGWGWVTGLRLLANVVTLGLIAWTVLPYRPARVAVPVYVITLIGLIPFLIQDRPQTLALVLAPVLAAMALPWLRGCRTPRWWAVLLLSAVWANVHGSWLMIPITLGLVTLGVVTRTAGRVAAVRTGTRLIALSFLGALLTPATWQSLTAIVRFSARTDLLVEWQPTMPAALYALPFTLLLGLLAWSWARANRVPAPEIVCGVGLVAFGMLATRNIPYSLVLLAPLVSTRLATVYPRGPAVGRTESRLLVASIVGAIVVGLGLAARVHEDTDPVSRAQPTRIASALAERPVPVRVLNTYGAAGVLLEFSDGNVELGIDGRADRYPSTYSAAYLAAVRDLTDWAAVVGRVEPDVAVLQVDEPLATHLESQGWRTVMRDGDYVLLESGTTT